MHLQEDIFIKNEKIGRYALGQMLPIKIYRGIPRIDRTGNKSPVSRRKYFSFRSDFKLKFQNLS
jgi:hypothetical protein